MNSSVAMTESLQVSPKGGNVSLRHRDDVQTQLIEIMDAYLADVEAGVAPNREQILNAHPHLRDKLTSFLDGLDFVHSVAPQLADPPDTSATTIFPQAAAKRLVNLGDYRIIRELGRGGMGVVYEAEQLSLGRLVALKVLPFANMLDQKQLVRFKNEARAAATLEHPNIVPVYAIGIERGVHYYAMKLIPGQSLAEVIKEFRADRQEELVVSESS